MALEPRFKISFVVNDSPVPSLSWLDASGYVDEGLIAADHHILLKIVDPNNITILKNVGYDTDDFSAPDIATGGGSKDDILPVLCDGDITKGTYSFNCKIQHTGGGAIYTLPADMTYDFQYDSPTVLISQSADCRTSELTSTDSTTYTVESIDPSITRTHTITKPEGSGANDPGSTPNATRVIGGGSTPATRLWTMEWQTAISSVLNYKMETWDGSTWISIDDTISGNKTINVQCEDEINQLQTALSAIYGRFFTALTTNRRESERLLNIIVQLLSLWQEYTDAERNGGDYSSYAGEMATILNEEGYTASVSTETEEIVPYGSGSGTCTANVITFVSSAPTGGNSGDMAIGTVGSSVAWNVYYNNGGTWTLQGNINAANAPILSSDVSDSLNTTATSEEDLKSYTLPAGTLDADGDYITVSAMFLVSSSSLIDMTLRLYFGGEKIAEYNHSAMASGYYLLTGEVYRNAVSAQTYNTYVDIWGNPNSIIGLSFDNATESLNSANIIKASTIKAVNGSGGDITCKYLIIEHRKQS